MPLGLIPHLTDKEIGDSETLNVSPKLTESQKSQTLNSNLHPLCNFSSVPLHQKHDNRGGKGERHLFFFSYRTKSATVHSKQRGHSGMSVPNVLSCTEFDLAEGRSYLSQ